VHSFEILARLAVDKRLCSRVRFMLQDVIDMSRNNWVPRRQQETATKLSEVHQQAKKEEEEMARIRAAADRRERRKSAPKKDQWEVAGGKDAPKKIKQKRAKAAADAAAAAAVASAPTPKGKAASGFGLLQDDEEAEAALESDSDSDSDSDSESDVSDESDAADAAAPVEARPQISEAAFRDESKTILRELFVNEDLVEACKRIAEMAAPHLHHVLVKDTICLAFDHRDRECRLAAAFLLRLCTEAALMTSEQVVQGMTILMESIEEYEVDAPLALQLCAVVVAPLTVRGPSGPALPLSFFTSDAITELTHTGKAAKLLALVVAQLAIHETEAVARQLVLQICQGDSSQAIVDMFTPLMRSNQRNEEAVKTMLNDRQLGFLLA
jgi:hypothetical protein